MGLALANAVKNGIAAMEERKMRFGMVNDAA